jgi:hypothetical protein
LKLLVSELSEFAEEPVEVDVRLAAAAALAAAVADCWAELEAFCVLKMEPLIGFFLP